MGAIVQVEAFVVLVVFLGFEHLFELLGQLGVLLERSFDVVQETVGHFAQALDFNRQPRHFASCLEQRQRRNRVARLQVGWRSHPQAGRGDAARGRGVQQGGDERRRTLVVGIR